ncbi:rhodoquinone biosynthesis methyltransferase RquA [Roseateles violae]|uniref:Rhodoquinone biosynthesis methyltransferase RquA n=1 Tax=Roseateles violae TaxID=3058042 RepID=A0ABT8DW46_9BURK|nr:rhodoquinone biosynthesis methyltransferase RquA [Pelomonas sp. PFR6]MDN3922447.1 rhodoquinone biosynthesis methyltransferase RquA [Pelomonas sp. PFR6]
MATLQSSGSEASIDLTLARAAAVPPYLQQAYWWAYVHPNAVRVFERDWLVNAILWGNYGRLCDAALTALGEPLQGRNLQIACVYGNLTERLRARLAPDAGLDVVDVLPVQLSNLARKLGAPDPRVRLRLGDASAMTGIADASYERVLLFFLLHEMPEATRRATLAEALRVLRPGGRLVIVDYHRPPPWHPLRLPMRAVFHRLEPYAIDLWRQEIAAFMPADAAIAAIEKQTYFGGLYQRLVITR